MSDIRILHDPLARVIERAVAAANRPKKRHRKEPKPTENNQREFVPWLLMEARWFNRFVQAADLAAHCRDELQMSERLEPDEVLAWLDARPTMFGDGNAKYRRARRELERAAREWSGRNE